MNEQSDILKLIGQLQFIRDYECKNENEVKAMCEAIRILSESPAQRDTGYWELLPNSFEGAPAVWVGHSLAECTKCHRSTRVDVIPMYGFCPNCGRRMDRMLYDHKALEEILRKQ